MTAPLINRLIEDLAYPQANADNIAELISGNEYLLLFFPGNPDRYLESNDVAVILPELINAFQDKLSPAVVLIEDEETLRERYPFKLWPSLVFLRRGVQIGTIGKVQDWVDYMEQIGTLLDEDAAANQAIPSITL